MMMMVTHKGLIIQTELETWIYIYLIKRSYKITQGPIKVVLATDHAGMVLFYMLPTWELVKQHWQQHTQTMLFMCHWDRISQTGAFYMPLAMTTDHFGMVSFTSHRLGNQSGNTYLQQPRSNSAFYVLSALIQSDGTCILLHQIGRGMDFRQIQNSWSYWASNGHHSSNTVDGKDVTPDLFYILKRTCLRQHVCRQWVITTLAGYCSIMYSTSIHNRVEMLSQFRILVTVQWSDITITAVVFTLE